MIIRLVVPTTNDLSYCVFILQKLALCSVWSFPSGWPVMSAMLNSTFRQKDQKLRTRSTRNTRLQRRNTAKKFRCNKILQINNFRIPVNCLRGGGSSSAISIFWRNVLKCSRCTQYWLVRPALTDPRKPLTWQGVHYRRTRE